MTTFRLPYRFLAAGSVMAIMLILTGCTVERHDRITTIGVPVGAIEEKTGVGRLTWDAPKYGKVFVVDRDDETMVYQGPLHAGDHFVVDPDDNRIAANGQRLIQRRLKGSHRHTIYFREE